MKKNALVKCRLCFECSYKLNYHHKRREVTKRKKKIKRKKRKRSRSSSSSSQSDSNSNEKNRKQKKKTRKSGSEDEEKQKAEEEAELEQKATDLWSKPLEKEDEKTRTEVFDNFLEDLFL